MESTKSRVKHLTYSFSSRTEWRAKERVLLKGHSRKYCPETKLLDIDVRAFHSAEFQNAKIKVAAAGGELYEAITITFISGGQFLHFSFLEDTSNFRTDLRIIERCDCCKVLFLVQFTVMDPNSTPNAATPRVQPSIRSFFQPRQPIYSAPPAPPVSKSETISPLPQISQLPPQPPAKVAKPTSTIPEQATISPILEQHIPALRRINALLLPISYPDSFYHKILSPDAPVSFSRVILWTDPKSLQVTVVGGVVCRLDPALASDSTPQGTNYIPGSFDIYIQSLALLSPYRRMGLVAEVLKQVIEAATSQSNLKVASLYAHVWTENEEALEWYTSRSFKREEPVLHGYYRRLKPDTAWIFRRRLQPSDHLSNSQSSQNGIPAAQSTEPTSNSVPASTTRPKIPPSARSFQERGPDREWNDLPEDILGSNLKPPSLLGSKDGSATSSRSSSKSGIEKGRKKRAYPAAAFGS